MAYSHGKSAVVLMSGINMSNYLKNIDTSYTGEALETTVFNSSGVKSYIPGKVDATLSGDGLFENSTDVKKIGEFLGSSTQQVWSVYPYGSTIGSYGYGLKTRETAFDISTPFDDVVSMAVESQSNVGRERMVSLRTLGSATTTSTGLAATVVDNAANSAVGCVGYIQRTDTGTRTLTGSIQHSSGGAYSSLIAFTVLAAKGGERVAVSSTNVKRYTKATWTLGATTKSVTFQIGFSRK